MAIFDELYPSHAPESAASVHRKRDFQKPDETVRSATHRAAETYLITGISFELRKATWGEQPAKRLPEIGRQCYVESLRLQGGGNA